MAYTLTLARCAAAVASRVFSDQQRRRVAVERIVDVVVQAFAEEQQRLAAALHIGQSTSPPARPPAVRAWRSTCARRPADRQPLARVEVPPVTGPAAARLPGRCWYRPHEDEPRVVPRRRRQASVLETDRLRPAAAADCRSTPARPPGIRSCARRRQGRSYRRYCRTNRPAASRTRVDRLKVGVQIVQQEDVEASGKGSRGRPHVRLHELAERPRCRPRDGKIDQRRRRPASAAGRPRRSRSRLLSGRARSRRSRR